MGGDLRRLLSFECEGAMLAGSLDAAGGRTGLLMVTGGSQTRIGSHRMYERLAFRLASDGIACFRFDRRGVGDSDGADPGFRGSAPDIGAALAAFRREQPRLEQVFGFGLCDGATALALFAADLDGLILVNPWLVEAESGAPPPAAIRSRYRARLSSLSGWRDLLSGAVSYRKLIKGVLKLVRPRDEGLAGEVAAALARHRPPIQLILARGDATAIAAADAWRQPAFARVARDAPAPITIESDSHSFAHPGDEQALRDAVRESLARFGRA